jgi:hypothetical protein
MESRTTSAIMPILELKEDGTESAVFTAKDTKGRLGIFTEHFDKNAKDTKLSLMWVDLTQRVPRPNQTDFPTREAAVAEFKKWETSYVRNKMHKFSLECCLAKIIALRFINEELINRTIGEYDTHERGESGEALDIKWFMRWNELDASNVHSAFKKVSNPRAQKVLQLLKDYEGGTFLGRLVTGHAKRHHGSAVKSVIYFYLWDESILNYKSKFTPYSPEQKAEFYNANVKTVLTRLKQAMGPKEVAAMHQHGDLYKILRLIDHWTTVDFFKLDTEFLPAVPSSTIVHV